MSKHTPGPWYTRLSGNETSHGAHWEVRHDAGHKWHVADVYGVTDGDKTYGHGMAQANASLIAAAPELLAACKAVVSECESVFVDTAEMTTEWRQIYADIRAAIAKAEGEVS